MSEVCYQMASWPDEEELVAEVMVDDEIVAFVKRVGGATELTVASPFLCSMSSLIDVLQLVRAEFDASS